MDTEQITQVANIATQLGSYGVMGVIGGAVMAIVYLFRRVSALHVQVTQTVEKYAAESKDVALQVAAAMRDSTQAIAELRTALEDLRRSQNG